MSFDVVVTLPSTMAEIIAHRIATIVTTEINTTTTPATPYMTVGETAEYLRWPKERIYKLTAARAIPHHKHERRILFRRDVLDAWLDEYAEGPRLGETATGKRRATRGA